MRAGWNIGTFRVRDKNSMIMYIEMQCLSQRLRAPFLLASLILLTATTIACSTVHKDFKPAALSQQSQPDIPGKVAIVIPDSLCSIYYNNRNLTEFELGQVVCQNTRNAARQVFPKARIYRSENDIKPGEADFIGSVQPGKVLTYSDKREIPAKVFARVNLTWEFSAVDGSRQYHATVYGQGKDVRTFGRADIRNESSMQECMDDLATNLLQEMTTAYDKAGKNVATIARIRGKLEHYQPGINTYAQYLTDKENDWRIYSLNEHVKYNGRSYGYVIDPELNVHMSTMGRWNTQWDRSLPFMQSLRPSFHLLDRKIDSSEITDVNFKEAIGSAYDDHPLCELVFEGEGLDTAVLVQKTCQKDFTSSKAYTSKDLYHERGFSITAQKWLQLRVGMSKQEIGAFIGIPPRIEINTATHSTIFEYGYGRVRYSNEDGLIYWQISEKKRKDKNQRGRYNQKGSHILEYSN